MPKGNIYDQIPDDLSREVFEVLAKFNELKIERIISKGQKSPGIGWYDQTQNEWVIVLRGVATIAFENESTVTLKEGDYVEIPAHKKHKVISTSTSPETIWLAIHY